MLELILQADLPQAVLDVRRYAQALGANISIESDGLKLQLVIRSLDPEVLARIQHTAQVTGVQVVAFPATVMKESN